jgi:nucleoid DNA-binding protein
VIQATVDSVFASIMEIVSEGNSVTILGFGKFDAVSRSERVGRNPQTGESVIIPAKLVPAFQPGKDFKRFVALGSVEE